MDRHSGKQRMMRERATYHYLEALDAGDIDGLIEVLKQATYDAPLEEMVLQAHQAYFQEEQTQKAALVDWETQGTLPVLVSPPDLSRTGRETRRSRERRLARWMQVMAAMLIVGVLIGSFLALYTLRGSGSATTPIQSPLCQSSPLEQFDLLSGLNPTEPNSSLASVTAVSDNDAWAVGTAFNDFPGSPSVIKSTLIEHWDGKKWQVASSPNSADGNGELTAVAALSMDDVWAVGYSSHGKFSFGEAPEVIYRTLIEHWNGQQWQIVPSPNGSAGNGMLNALAVVSATDIWAVGSFDDAKQVVRPFLEQWDGKSWRIISLAGGGTPVIGWLTNVGASSANDVWAVGLKRAAGTTQLRGLVEHWNGSQWQSEPTPQTSITLNSVSVLSAQNVWATGGDIMGNSLVEHWNGQRWKSVTLPGSSAGNKEFFSYIVAVSASNIWVAGNVQGTNRQQERMFLVHWNGTIWRQMSIPALRLSPITPDTYAKSIASDGGHQIWIVGNAYNGEQLEGGSSSWLILGERTCP